FNANGDSPGTSTWFRSGTGGDPTPRLPGAPPPALAEAVSNVLASGRVERIRDPSGGTTGIALPLAGRGGIYGALAMSSTRRYSTSDLELIEIIASRTAVVLENRRLYRELQDRDRRKDEFLAMLSHELRNPLGAVTNAVQVLEAKTLDERT